MNLNKLLELIKEYDIPEDVKLLSDSGWECGSSEMDGLYYNRNENVLVFTQYIDVCDSYHKHRDWEIISGK